ncbi:hypothetical protein LARI1_G000982 [Lachnellula arida]|uniref:AB hydrolase-1 domain-containing protein n=1 Tax=Lachnellula arida TaxID=1316785 RepID=A0A8T9BNG8_9HELO|nr:hypothetical protein LARI1_G000982 [Lachnellula arida]
MSDPTKSPTDYASVSPPQKLTIPSKPDAPISYSFFPPTNQPDAAPKRLIVFINGLGLPASSWLPSISIFREDIKSCPAILTYDRFGQGLTTSKDPLDGTPGKENGHDFVDVANDLHEIIVTIATTKLGLKASDVEDGTLHLLLLGASIGARFYVSTRNTTPALWQEQSSSTPTWPTPIIPTSGLILTLLASTPRLSGARERMAGMFDLKVKNAEGIDRLPGPTLLPHADGPKLVGPGGKGPWLSVVGHEPETFAQVSLDMMGTPKSLSMRFTSKYWAEYNQGLTKITDRDTGGVVIAPGCAHFIQKDGPGFLAQEVMSMIKKLGW